MRKTISLVLAGVLALALLPGFVKAENTASVLTKEQEQLLQTAESGREGSVLLPELEVPDRFTGDWSGVEGFINVHADAAIELPDAEKIPIGTISRRDFTQEDADNLMRVFLKGNTLYEELGMTKQRALDRLEQYEAMQRGEIPLEGDSLTLENLPEVIERWKEYVRSAPEGDERIPASTRFESKDYGEELRGWAEVDGRELHLFIQNQSSFWDHASVFEPGYGDLNGTWAQPISLIPDEALPEPLTVGFSAGDALSQGDELIAKLGFQNVICDEITPVFFTSTMNPYAVDADESLPEAESDIAELILATGYELHYVRCLNGFPIGYTSASGTASTETGAPTRAWMYEYITIDITEDGVKCFQWFSPHTEPVMLAEDSRLLPFNQVAEIFARMMMVKNNDVLYANARNGFTTTRNFRINKVSLTIMRIRDRENFDEGMLIPVWDFCGTVQYEYDGWDNYGFTGDHEERIFLTINAVDGSIIDRDLGF